MFLYSNNNIINRVPGVAILTSIVPTLPPITKRILGVFFQTLGKTLFYTSMGVIPFLSIKNPLLSVTMKAVLWAGITASAILIIQYAVAGVMEILKLRKQRQHIQEIIFIAKTLEGCKENVDRVLPLTTAAKKYEEKNYDDLASLEEVSKELQATYDILKNEHHERYDEQKVQNDLFSAQIDNIRANIAIFQSGLDQSEMKVLNFKDDKNKLRSAKLKLSINKSCKIKHLIELNETLLNANFWLLPSNVVFIRRKSKKLDD